MCWQPQRRRSLRLHILAGVVSIRQAAIRNSSWKYLKDQDGTPHLYNLRTDPTEAVDLATALPKKLARLAERHQRWADANNVMPYDELQSWRQANRKNRGAEKTKPKTSKRGKGRSNGA